MAIYENFANVPSSKAMRLGEALMPIGNEREF
jgi:hypothetical protein